MYEEYPVTILKQWNLLIFFESKTNGKGGNLKNGDQIFVFFSSFKADMHCKYVHGQNKKKLYLDCDVGCPQYLIFLQGN